MENNLFILESGNLCVCWAVPIHGSHQGGTQVHIVAMSIGEMGHVFCRFGINIVVGTVIAKMKYTAFLNSRSFCTCGYIYCFWKVRLYTIECNFRIRQR